MVAVAPFAGAWIEIERKPHTELLCNVAPFAGAWIEIVISSPFTTANVSLRSPERGLKYHRSGFQDPVHSRSVRRSVDCVYKRGARCK